MQIIQTNIPSYKIEPAYPRSMLPISTRGNWHITLTGIAICHSNFGPWYLVPINSATKLGVATMDWLKKNCLWRAEFKTRQDAFEAVVSVAQNAPPPPRSAYPTLGW